MKRPRISNGITEVRIENWEHSLIFFYSFASITFFIRIIIIRIAWLSSSVYALMNKMVKMQTSDVSHELAQPFFSVINVRFYYFLARAPCCCACSSSSCGTLNATKTKIKIVEFFQMCIVVAYAKVKNNEKGPYRSYHMEQNAWYLQNNSINLMERLSYFSLRFFFFKSTFGWRRKQRDALLWCANPCTNEENFCIQVTVCGVIVGGGKCE